MNTIYEKIHDLLNEKNVPEYRFNQILHSIFKQRIGKYEDMKTLPQSIREMLISEFGSTVYGVRPTLENDLGQVGKMLFELCDGNKVEAVCLRYQRGLHILSMWLLFWLQVLRHWNARPKAKYDRRRNNRPTFVFLPFRPQFRQHFFYGNGGTACKP